MISFNVTNELTYSSPGDSAYLDYSSWANSSWNSWRQQRGLSAASMPLPSEASSRPTDWKHLQQFRQDQLNQYFNQTYTAARSGLSSGDDELVFHRHNWYAASDSFANRRGIYLDSNLQNGADVNGGNIYGGGPAQAAMYNSSGKPVFLTETNHPALHGNASVSPSAMNTAMLTQFFEGAQNQMIYQFGGGDYYPMRNNDNTVHPAFAQFKAMAQKIDRIQEFDLTPQARVGFLWSR